MGAQCRARVEHGGRLGRDLGGQPRVLLDTGMTRRGRILGKTSVERRRVILGKARLFPPKLAETGVFGRKGRKTIGKYREARKV